MIYGVGVDMATISRIEKSLGNDRFARFVFSREEREAFLDGPRAAEKLAGCFAGKEAFGKALGTGISGFSLAEVSVLRTGSGAPYYKFSGAAAELIEQKRLLPHLTLSNEDGCAMAVCLLEVREK